MPKEKKFYCGEKSSGRMKINQQASLPNPPTFTTFFYNKEHFKPAFTSESVALSHRLIKDVLALCASGLVLETFVLD